MRVVLFLRSLLYGGTERQTVVLARELARRGHAVHVVALYGGGAFSEDLASAGIQYSQMGKRGRYDLIGPHARLVRLVREWRADVLYSFLPAQNIAAAVIAPLLGHCKLVLGVRAAGLELGNYDWLARLTYRIEAYAARQASLIIANSRRGIEWCRARGFPAFKLKLVPNGIDVDRFRPDPAARKEVRLALGIADDQCMVALVGRLDGMKDHPTFLRAAALLAEGHPQMVFVCAGNGSPDYQAQLRTLSSNLGIDRRLMWLPAQDAIARFMCAVDVAVLSSAFGEGFPNVVAEAMACGVPVATTDVGDCREILEGLLPVAPAGNPEALAGLIEEVIGRNNTVLSALLRERIVSRYGEHALGKNTEDFLMQIGVGGHPGKGFRA